MANIFFSNMILRPAAAKQHRLAPALGLNLCCHSSSSSLLDRHHVFLARRVSSCPRKSVRLCGKTLSREVLSGAKQDCDRLLRDFGIVPCLVTILVGNHPESIKYLENKLKAANKVGIQMVVEHLPESASKKQGRCDSVTRLKMISLVTKSFSSFGLKVPKFQMYTLLGVRKRVRCHFKNRVQKLPF